MRYCIYCGMPMEDDDLFCTRCGKEALKDEPAVSSKNTLNQELLADERTLTGTLPLPGSDQSPGAGAAGGSGRADGRRGGTMKADTRGREFAGGAAYSSGRRVGSGTLYNDAAEPSMRPRDSYTYDNGNGPDYDDPFMDSEPAMPGRRIDSGRYIMVAAAAVIVAVLGILLFMLVKPGAGKNDDSADNTVAVHDEEQRQEQNLTQGQQTPSSGKAVSESSQEQNAASQNAQEQTQGSGSAAVQSDSNKDDSQSSVTESGQDAQTAGAGGESGWVVDEEGNEVYYPEDDETYTDYNQTGDGSEKNVDSGTEEAQSSDPDPVETQTTSPDGNGGLAGNNVTGDSSYILPDSDSRYYTRAELTPLDDYTLQMAINELYARHGRKFDTESIREYFESKSWYHGTIDPADFDGNEAAYFNEYEIGNRELMSQIRAEREEKQTSSTTTAQ